MALKMSGKPNLILSPVAGYLQKLVLFLQSLGTPQKLPEDPAFLPHSIPLCANNTQKHSLPRQLLATQAWDSGKQSALNYIVPSLIPRITLNINGLNSPVKRHRLTD